MLNNLKDKILQIREKIGDRQALGILLLLVIVIALPLTVYLVRQQQNIRSQAAGGAVKIVLTPRGNNYVNGSSIPIDISIQSDPLTGTEQLTGADITVSFDGATLSNYSFAPASGTTLSEEVLRSPLSSIGSFRYVAVNTGGALQPVNSVPLGTLTLKVNSLENKQVIISVNNSKVVALTQALALSSSSDPITLTINSVSSPSPSASPSIASCTVFSPQGLTPAEVKDGLQVYKTASYNDAGTKYLNANYSPSGATFTPSSTPNLEIGRVQGTNQLYANIPVNNDTTANVEYTVSAKVSSSNTVDCPSFIIRVPKKPGDTTCPYDSTQARMKTSTGTTWLTTLSTAPSTNILVAGFHDNTSTIQSDVLLTATGPVGDPGNTTVSLTKDTATNIATFTPTLGGTYSITAATEGKTGNNCTGNATLTINQSASPSPSASPTTISAPSVFSTLSPNCITPGYEGDGLSVIWNGSGIAFVDIDTAAGNFTGTYYHSNGFSNLGSAYKITAPKDTTDSLFGAYSDGCTPGFNCPPGTLSFNPSTAYVFRLFDGTNHSAAARYNTPPACVASPSPSPTPPARVPGDATNDGCVNNYDKDCWSKEYSGTSSGNSADFNNDGKVDGADYAIWLSADNSGSYSCSAGQARSACVNR